KQRPERQQDERMRSTAVMLEVGGWAENAEDEIEVRRRTGKKARRHAPHGRAPRRIVPSARAGDKGAGESVGQRIQSANRLQSPKSNRPLTPIFYAACFLRWASLACIWAYAPWAAASALPTCTGKPMPESTDPSAERHSITLSGRQE